MTDSRRTAGARPARLVAQRLAPATPALRAAHQAVLRRALVTRLKLLAISVGAQLEVTIDPSVVIDGMPQLEIYPQTWNRLRIAERVTIGDGVRLSLRGGHVEIGPDTELRRHSNYQVGGELIVGAGVVVSTGVVVHCAESIRIGDLTIIGEYTTIADSAHRRTPVGVPIHHSSRSAPVVIGSNIWIGAHVVVTPGVTVGDQAFVGAGAVVTKDVSAGWLVGGVPARPLRELPIET